MSSVLNVKKRAYQLIVASTPSGNAAIVAQRMIYIPAKNAEKYLAKTAAIKDYAINVFQTLSSILL